jgi:hypothetical protein
MPQGNLATTNANPPSVLLKNNAITTSRSVIAKVFGSGLKFG